MAGIFDRILPGGEQGEGFTGNEGIGLSAAARRGRGGVIWPSSPAP